MTSPYRLRPAIQADTETIAGWFPSHEQALLWGGPEVPAVLTAAWIAEQYRDASRRHLVLVAAADAVCGVYSLRSVPAEKRLHIGRLGVAPERRGAGLGSLMIAHAIELAHAESAEIVTLFVHERNTAARRLYERLGFRTMTDAPFVFENTQLMQRVLSARP